MRMTFGDMPVQLAGEGADAAALAAQVQSLHPALVAVLAPVVAGLAMLQARAGALGITHTEARVLRGLAATARVWGEYLRDPDALAGE